jgi:hypothetical protein
MGLVVSLQGINPVPLMSALGQKRTWRGEFPMSALPPIADIPERQLDVRFVPTPEVTPLFDQLVGALEEGL